MPYRHVPPHRRPWWEILTGVWFALIVAMGVAGLVLPSAAIPSPLGFGQLIFSILLIALGAASIGAWWTGHREPERVFMFGIAFLSLAHGVAVWFSSSPGVAQNGLRIIAAGVGTLAWVGIRQAFGISRATVEESVAQMEELDIGRPER